MTDLPDPGTDPIPDNGEEQYGFFARLVGQPLQERRLLKRFEQLIAVNTAALTQALTSLQETGEKLDNISPKASTKKGT